MAHPKFLAVLELEHYKRRSNVVAGVVGPGEGTEGGVGAIHHCHSHVERQLLPDAGEAELLRDHGHLRPGRGLHRDQVVHSRGRRHVGHGAGDGVLLRPGTGASGSGVGGEGHRRVVEVARPRQGSFGLGARELGAGDEVHGAAVEAQAAQEEDVLRYVRVVHQPRVGGGRGVDLPGAEAVGAVRVGLERCVEGFGCARACVSE